MTTQRDSPGTPTTALPHLQPAPVGEDDSLPSPSLPQSFLTEASTSSQTSFPRPPPFSAIYSTPLLTEAELNTVKETVADSTLAPLFPGLIPSSLPFPEEPLDGSSAPLSGSENEHVFDGDKKGESSGKSPDDGEPPPPYTEGSSPIQSFSYVMAAAGGAASIITQVQQSGGPPINTLGGMLIPGPK